MQGPLRRGRRAGGPADRVDAQVLLSQPRTPSRYELEVGDSVEGGGAVLRRLGGGALAADDGGRVAMALDPTQHDSDRVFALPLSGWFVALGEESTRLLWWRRGDIAFRVVDDLPRMPTAGYDPGGMRHVDFFAAPGDACLVATEECVALLHRDTGLVWTYVHTDVTVRVETVGRHAVVLRSEIDRSTLDVTNGRFVTSEPIG